MSSTTLSSSQYTVRQLGEVKGSGMGVPSGRAGRRWRKIMHCTFRLAAASSQPRLHR